ncbi:unannotated protein [freshwater metagenome]|uniref:Unannotated protein n=1 Tax=freshwater metagenome TaxID=449393 RepID=A0A6J7I335_9ZZZZ|nr:TetR family transcriptional regulator [Actinomycetota bacterium]
MTIEPGEPQLRADARRNRDAVLTAARRVFAAEGLDAPLESVAREAGVGRATLYRRFPTRNDLLAAVFDDYVDRVAAVVREAPDPAGAYLEVLEACLEIERHDRAFLDLLAMRPSQDPVVARLQVRFVELVDAPLRAAQEAGRVRADLEPADTLTIVEMLAAAVRLAVTGGDAQRSRRGAALLLDAITPAAAGGGRDLSGV